MDTTLGSVSSHRVSNLMKTGLLLAAMSALVLGIGQLIGGPRGLLLGGALVLIMNFVSFWFSDTLALKMNRARPLAPGELPWLEQATAQIAHRAGLPMPRLYIVESPTPNAFATGRSPEKAAVAVTTGLLELLSQRELIGVLAHELSHVKNHAGGRDHPHRADDLLVGRRPAQPG
jgi:heat shock protein HtpX